MWSVGNIQWWLTEWKSEIPACNPIWICKKKKKKKLIHPADINHPAWEVMGDSRGSRLMSCLNTHADTQFVNLLAKGRTLQFRNSTYPDILHAYTLLIQTCPTQLNTEFSRHPETDTGVLMKPAVHTEHWNTELFLCLVPCLQLTAHTFRLSVLRHKCH